MAADIKIKYGTTLNPACAIASLATSPTKVAGIESDLIDNTSVLALDYLLSGKITTGTSPSVGKSIQVWVFALLDGSGGFTGSPNYPDVFDGTTSSETVTSENVRNSALRLAANITVDSTSNRTYWFAPVSIAGLFGGSCPRKWGFFVVHDTGVNLNSTASNHAFWADPVLAQTV